MKKAIVLLSGGIDSVTTLAVAQVEGIEIYAISYNYGQKHGIELNFAKKSAERFHVKKHLIMNFDLRAIGGSALTSDMEVPKNSSLLTPHSSLIPVTYVPARNTIFLSFALAFAESTGSEDIFIGANAVDYSGYPDCRPEFINAFENLANLATKASVEGTAKFKIHAPLINLTKGEIIRRGVELGVDFSLTWSCYDPQKSQMDDGRKTTDEENRKTGILSFVPHPSSLGFVPCMRCDSCLLRAKGFREAGIKDPSLPR